jgi:hypothetical protein
VTAARDQQQRQCPRQQREVLDPADLHTSPGATKRALSISLRIA